MADEKRKVIGGWTAGAFKDPDTGKGWIPFVEMPNGDSDDRFDGGIHVYPTQREAMHEAQTYLQEGLRTGDIAFDGMPAEWMEGK